jgi:hypothetical protein
MFIREMKSGTPYGEALFNIHKTILSQIYFEENFTFRIIIVIAYVLFVCDRGFSLCI